jgi:hypothetical protein
LAWRSRGAETQRKTLFEVNEKRTRLRRCCWVCKGKSGWDKNLSRAEARRRREKTSMNKGEGKIPGTVF